MPSFTADSIMQLALNQAGNRAEDSALLVAAESELNLIIYQLEEGPDPYWFLLSEWSDANTVANEARLSLPDDFLLEDENSHLYLTNAAGTQVQLVKDDSDALKNKYLNATASQPKHYAVTGEYFELFPPPDLATYVLSMRYFQKAVDFTASIRTNVWTVNAADLLVPMLGQVMIKGYLQENNASSERMVIAEGRAKQRLRAKHVAREMVNENLSMGD